jgi:hypothetical protein
MLAQYFACLVEYFSSDNLIILPAAERDKAGRLLDAAIDEHGYSTDAGLIWVYRLNQFTPFYAIRTVAGRNLVCSETGQVARNAADHDTPWHLIREEQRRIRNDPSYRGDSVLAGISIYDGLRLLDMEKQGTNLLD